MISSILKVNAYLDYYKQFQRSLKSKIDSQISSFKGKIRHKMIHHFNITCLSKQLQEILSIGTLCKQRPKWPKCKFN